MIQVPGHGSTPSGHSTEAFAAAMVLIRLTTANKNPVYCAELSVVQLLRQAARIAINRQVAGLHFPVDTAAGAVLGMTLGSYLVQRLIPTAHYNAWSFDGDAYDPCADFKWLEYYDPKLDDHGRPIGQTEVYSKVDDVVRLVVFPISDVNPVTLGDPSPILNWIWARACGEWT